MKNLFSLIATLFFLTTSSVVWSDEVGIGKPGNNSNTQTTTQSVDSSTDDTTCSWLDKLRGKCEE